jgi:pantetheine-phosphate adenylyltransferase
MLAIYAGTFDPITYGHLDVLRQALNIFTRVEVSIGVNSTKQTLFSLDKRMSLIEEATSDLQGISVGHFEGLLIDYAKKQEAVALIRGIRQVTDFDYELRMTVANRRLAPEIQTVHFMPSEDQLVTSSSIVREIHRFHGDVSSFVPPCVQQALAELRNQH